MTEYETTIIGALKKAREILTPNGAWGQGYYAACDAKFLHNVDVMSDDAVCFCALGALRRATGYGIHDTFEDGMPYLAARECLERVLVNQSVIQYNDTQGRTQAQILSLFDRTIAILEREEKVEL